MLFLYIFAIVAGLAVLVWSADRFVMGASATAHNLGVPTLIIGMVIMGFGTSAPEMFVAAIAALQDNPALAVGNAIGSNIANIALVLGTASLIAPITVASRILRREYPALLIITATVFVLIIDFELSRTDGVILLLCTVIMVLWLLWMSKRSTDADPIESEFESEMPPEISTGKSLAWTFGALILLISSSHALVWGAQHIAHQFGVSDLVIGLTIIAVGTSLPEVAVSISAALKKEHDIVIGNVLGSNMFNSLAVIGIASTIQSSQLDHMVLYRDFAVMSGLTAILFLMCYGFRGPGHINRLEGLLLLLSYIGYMMWLYISAVHT